MDQYNLTFSILLDLNSNVAKFYVIKPIPTTYLVDSNGLISYKAFGAMKYDLMVQEINKQYLQIP